MKRVRKIAKEGRYGERLDSPFAERIVSINGENRHDGRGLLPQNAKSLFGDPSEDSLDSRDSQSVYDIGGESEGNQLGDGEETSLCEEREK